jgi:hypothetical protein
MPKSQFVRAGLLAAAVSLPLLLARTAEAAIVVSSAPTQNMNCAGGICANTTPDAVLNVNDLTAMLASGDATVLADTAALDIQVEAPFGLSSTYTLTLDANRSIAIDRGIWVTRTGGLTLTTNRGGAGGDFWFGRSGRVKFWNTASNLTINGVRHTLVKDLVTLAADIAAKPYKAYALADDYDASAHGVFMHDAVTTDFGGTFEGLGHTISNFSAYDSTIYETYVSLFGVLKKKAVVRDLNLVNTNILSENSYFQIIGTLAGYNAGTILQCTSTGGTIRSDFFMIGGGLVGLSYGTISRSSAAVEVEGAEDAEVGGLVGNAHGHVTDSYATGHTIAGDQSDIGGLIGYNLAKVKSSYATGSVSGGQYARVGGLMGSNLLGHAHHTYWDTSTSGASAGVASGDSSGVYGLSSDELQAGLPKGFDPAIWTQNRNINNGFPYLKSAPPK